MTCATCGGSGHPPLSQSRVEICEACGGKGHLPDPSRIEEAPPPSDRGLETTKAPHEIQETFGHSDSPLGNDGGH
jgi:DnaJ-class molecular chaperone